MLKHIHAEHSREIHVRAMAMVMERQHTPFAFKKVQRRTCPWAVY